MFSETAGLDIPDFKAIKSTVIHFHPVGKNQGLKRHHTKISWEIKRSRPTYMNDKGFIAG